MRYSEQLFHPKDTGLRLLTVRGSHVPAFYVACCLPVPSLL